MANKTIIKDLNKLVTETSSQRILLEEFRSLHNQYLNRRNEAVTRVNFFMTAASFALGGVLVFGSGSSSVSPVYFRIILMATLVILFIVGLEIYNYLIQRDLASDRDIRGLARIRNYFAKLDSDLEDYFVNIIHDIPTGYLINNSSGMRRVMQIIEGFLLGMALILISTFVTSLLEIYVAIGFGITTLIYLLLEANARRRFRKVLKAVEKDVKFKKNANTK